MKIDLYFTANEVTEDRLKDHLAVVVDVLRASTTICEARQARIQLVAVRALHLQPRQRDALDEIAL